MLAATAGGSMQSSGRVAVLAAALACAALAAGAQVPDAEAVARDLATIYATRAAEPQMGNQTETGRSLVPLIVGQGTYLLGELRPWEKDGEALLLTDGNHREHGIRPNAHTAFSFAAMYRTVPAEAFGKHGREEFRDAAVGVLRFVLPTHGAGGATCSDGSPWKGQWQSAHWADSAGRAAWLLWDELDPRMQWLAARMITDEADRFVGQRPPAQIDKDTKAEENAWNSMVVSLAYSMFPQHPNREKYRETAIRWALSSFVRPADLAANPTIDGRTLAQWDVGANIHDDWTLENHDRIHPDYMSTITLLLHQIPVYAWGGNEPPQALYFNAREIYANLKRFSFPDGNHVYPSGQDWRLHRNADWMEVHLPMAILERDAQAAALFECSRDAAERMLARAPENGIYQPGEYSFPSTQMLAMDRALVMPYLFDGLLGAGPEPRPAVHLWSDLAGKHVFEGGKFAVVRTARSVATFAWGHQVMGMNIPLQEDLVVNPLEGSMVGFVQRAGAEDERPVVRETKIVPRERDFALCGILDRAGGAVEQRFAFVALKDGRTVYVDSVRAVQPSDAPTTLSLGTVSILDDANWVYHDARRTLSTSQGAVDITPTMEIAQPLVFDSNWIAIDDALGIVVLERSGAIQLDPRVSTARERTSHQLHLNHGTLGAEPFRTALVFHPMHDAAWTADAARRTRIESADDGTRTIVLEDDTLVAVDLEKMEIRLP